MTRVDMFPEMESTSYCCVNQSIFFLPQPCGFIMNISTQEDKADRAAPDTWDVNSQAEFYMTPIIKQCSLIWRTLRPHNMESIQFRLNAPSRHLFVSLSIFSIWLLCKQHNQYNKPTNIYHPSAWPEGRDTTTIHEWKLLSCGRWYRDICFTF